MIDYNQLYQSFVTHEKSKLIAPAGYGKTYAISESLKWTKGHQLILTHTHAGVASIKEKIKIIKPECKYTVETISSFAQKYVEAFYCGMLPDQDDAGFFQFIIKKAAELFHVETIKTVLKVTYSGLFVDEYQDCSKTHQLLIFAISKLIPTHVLGDPLQGIFNFNNEPLVDFETDLYSYKNFELHEPWRWKKTNPALGEYLKEIRSTLLKGKPVDIGLLDGIENCKCLIIKENDIYVNGSDYRKWLNRIAYNNKSIADLNDILVLSHENNIWQRIKLNQKLGNRFHLIEAFDDKDFYKFSKSFDMLTQSDNLYHDLITLLKGRIDKRGKKRSKRVGTLLSGLNNYFNNDFKCPNPKRKELSMIVNKIKLIESNFDFSLLASILISLSKLENVRIVRNELFYDLCNSFQKSSIEKISVFESMKEIRNVKRRVGRKINGKYIGTTLLTKGLEAKTVVILDAHKFTDPKNFYVAMTRASSRLIVFSEENILNPY
ncbi:DNA helicase-2 / ATP-dependent DNA helicase PcrA [Tangfeifania diversioriginum]|uniref:DNA 3'-5' helicase II n=2 Tax=Tangfeifania diversioriginum TaxID=1168035 RepID=A0A1M6NX15_9BACT|nr:DNA helicase-2 / ATP-dependent DNA helicase PcrA [Tangfeifania diversioriginum]